MSTEPWPATALGRLCQEREIRSDWYARWTTRLGSHPQYNRKQWEHIAIAEAVQALGIARPGSRGLGFGVGQEPMPALLAGLGCTLLATDLPAEDGADGWARSGQHCQSLDRLQIPSACLEAEFRARVSYRPVNMTRIPADLRDFDFTWSACALEHLGSLEAGLRFLIDQARCLKPGGFGIHTTEFNVLSNDRTWSAGGTVAYRARDLMALASGCRRAGLELLPLSLNTGNGPMDWVLDTWPYRPEPHLKLLAEGSFVLTSVLLVVHRPERCKEVLDPGPMVIDVPAPITGPDGPSLTQQTLDADDRLRAEADLWRLRYLAASGEGGEGAERVAALEAECRRWREAYLRLAGHPMISPLLWLRRRLTGRREPTTR